MTNLQLFKCQNEGKPMFVAIYSDSLSKTKQIKEGEDLFIKNPCF